MTGQPEESLSMPNVGTKVIQVTNIAPQTTRDQMHTLFGFVGKIEDIRLYPTARDVSLPVQSRICYVKYFDSTSVGVAQHLTNTVFIDRALIVTPYQAKGGEIPDEYRALDIANQASVIPGLGAIEPKLPAHIANRIEGMPPNQVITTHDPVLESSGLPPYPPLPITYDARRIEEIRRTVMVMNVEESMGEELLDFFLKFGDVKYIRFCTRDNDNNTYALVEFSEQSSIIPALQSNGSQVGGGSSSSKIVSIYHSTQAISKPMAKSNEAAQKEIEEAMTRVKEAQSMISAAIDPVIGILSKDKKRSRSSSRRRSRSRSRRRSRSRSKYRRRSRSRRRRSRSRTSRARRSRSRGRKRTPSRERQRRRRSSSRKRSRDRKRSRSRGHSSSRPRKSRKSSKERHRSSSRTRKSRSREKHRSRSKEKHRSRSKDKHRSRSKEKRRSRSREKIRSRSREKRRSRSKEKHRSRSRSKMSRSKERQRSKSPRSKKSRSSSRSRKRSSRSPSDRSSRSVSRKPANENGSTSSKDKSKSKSP